MKVLRVRKNLKGLNNVSELRAGHGSTANKARQLQSNSVVRVKYETTIRMRYETATTSYN